MSLAERLMILLMEAQAKSSALDEETTTLAREISKANREWLAAREEAHVCQRDLERKRAEQASIRSERDKLMAELRTACERLGIKGPDAP